MGELNDIQNEVYVEMNGGSLSDVTKSFNASRFIPSDDYDPDEPMQGSNLTYSGKGIFGLSFNVSDSAIFQIEQNDQKAIVFMNYSTDKPKNQDLIIYDDWAYRIIEHVVIPADNGWTLQLRALSKADNDKTKGLYPSLFTFPSDKTFMG